MPECQELFFFPVKRHSVRPGHGCAGDGGGVLDGEGELGVDGGGFFWEDGDGFTPNAGTVGVVGGEMPSEGAVAELFVLVDLFFGNEAGILF